MMLMTIMINVIYVARHKQALYAECHYTEPNYDECHYAECHYTEPNYDECHYAECHCAEQHLC
jgi:hypothetical protein